MKYFEPSLLRSASACCSGSRTSVRFHAGFAALCDGDKLRGSVSRPLRRAGRALQGQDQFQAARRATASSRIKTSRRAAGTYADLFQSPRWSASTSTTAENGCLELCAGTPTRAGF